MLEASRLRIVAALACVFAWALLAGCAGNGGRDGEKDYSSVEQALNGISLDNSSYATGATIHVTYSGLNVPTVVALQLAPTGTDSATIKTVGITKASGTTTFIAPANDGEYLVRAVGSDYVTALASSSTFTVTGGASAAVTLPNGSSYAAGASNLVVSYSGLNGDACNLIALAAPGTGSKWLADKCSGSKTSGSVTFTVPADNGPYVVEVLQDDNSTWTTVLASAELTVAGSSTPPAVTLPNGSSYNAGASNLVVDFSGLNEDACNYIVLAATGNGGKWFADKCSGSKASGSVTFTAPADNGDYLVEVLADDGTFATILASATLTVTGSTNAATISTDKTTYVVGSDVAVAVTYTGLNGDPNNLVELQVVGTNDCTSTNSYHDAVGGVPGPTTLSLPLPTYNGIYFATILQSGQGHYCAAPEIALATSTATFTVTGGTDMTVSADNTTYVAGDTITATFTGFQDPNMTLVLFDVTSSTIADSVALGTGAFTATAAEGNGDSYEIKAMADDGAHVLATSTTFTINNNPAWDPVWTMHSTAANSVAMTASFTGGTPAFVQSEITQANTSPSSVSTSFGANVTAGDLLVAVEL
jgi:hypothetical protein